MLKAYLQLNSYRTTLCLQFSPNQIAVGAIFMAALCMSLQPCNSRSTTTEYTWFELLEVDIEEDSLKCNSLAYIFDKLFH